RSSGPVDEVGRTERAGELVDPSPCFPRLDAPETGVDLEIPPSAQGAVDDGLLKDHAAGPACGERLRRNVEPGQPGFSRGRLDRRRQHPDGGRLAGAVRSEQAEDLAGGDVE